MKRNLTSIAMAIGAAGCIWALPGQSASAAAIYDNLSFPSAFGDYVTAVRSNGRPGDGPLADSFSTGSGNYTLTDVKLLVDVHEGNPTPGGSVTVSLLSDNSTSPGSPIAVLGTFADSGLTETPSLVDLPEATGIALDPSTRYWVELSTDNQSNVEWDAAGGTGGGSEPVSSTYGTAPDQWGGGGEGEFFYAGNAIAEGYPTDVFPNGPGNNVPYEMQVNAAVPEPASLPLLAFGLAALGLAWSRNGVRRGSRSLV